MTNCSCPDWANPCKHIAAVYYLLAERFDDDPFLIFKLRGRSKEEIIQALRARRAEGLPSSPLAAPVSNPQPAQREALAESLESFWQAGEGLESFVLYPDIPRIDKAVLKRLGRAPFAIQSLNLALFLERAYDAIDEALAEQSEQDQRRDHSSSLAPRA